MTTVSPPFTLMILRLIVPSRKICSNTLDQNTKNLKIALKEEWGKKSTKIPENLADSITNRLKVIIKAREFFL